MKQYLVIHLTEVTTKDFTGKYRKLISLSSFNIEIGYFSPN